MRGRRKLALAFLALLAMLGESGAADEESYLPTGSATAVLTVSKDRPAAAGVMVMTEALAVNETGPKQTVDHFGETYAFSPAVFAVYRDQPTLITFRNLQPDDEHDFMLTDPENSVLMKVRLAPLSDTAYVFTFHRPGIFPFYCTLHQPGMSGQIIVLPHKARSVRAPHRTS
ncbi:MAG TPA: hypothetical protein VEI94_14175 [Candidatus Bathyarchaeia archaeon]|nr:hypothetical protein [Candidatus Bathyarchaeia archaeon]